MNKVRRVMCGILRGEEVCGMVDMVVEVEDWRRKCRGVLKRIDVELFWGCSCWKSL
jgi:hypothetical protein